MKILFIATGFAPYSFSENIINSKLVLAFLKEGWKVDVISRKDEGNTYSNNWDNEWKELQHITHEVIYPTGNKIQRLWDTVTSSIAMGIPLEGVRWAKRAYYKALELHEINHYDVVISRSPTDMSHLPAYYFAKKTGVKWIANWNDPAAHIWPEPYTHKMSFWKRKLYERLTNTIVGNADINTFPSEDLRDYFMRFLTKLKEKNSAIIPHIGFPSIHIVQKNVVSTFRMCHAGNLSKERNPERFFQALAQFLAQNQQPDIVVDLLGVADQDLEILVEKYALENNIRFIGSLPYMDALAKMGQYDILLIIEADLEDGIFLPSKMTDYSQLGVPIFAITPQQSCIEKLLAHYGGGLSADCSSVDSICSTMQQLYDNWKIDHSMKKYDTTYLYTCFKPQNIVKKYQKVFSELGL